MGLIKYTSSFLFFSFFKWKYLRYFHMIVPHHHQNVQLICRPPFGKKTKKKTNLAQVASDNASAHSQSQDNSPSPSLSHTACNFQKSGFSRELHNTGSGAGVEDTCSSGGDILVQKLNLSFSLPAWSRYAILCLRHTAFMIHYAAFSLHN